MGDTVICLACGGVAEGTPGPEDHRCACPPPDDEAEAIECPSCGGRLRIGVRACPFCRSSVGTTRCTECLAWNSAEAAFCQQCGRDLHAGEPDECRSTSRVCPGDGGPLVTRRYADWDIDECDGCGGVFVVASTLDCLLADRETTHHGLRLALPKPSPPSDGSNELSPIAYPKCPECRVPMMRRNFARISGVLVDVCNEHGVWFDAGELSAVLTFVARGGWDNPRARRHTFARPDGTPKGSFTADLDFQPYDAMAEMFCDALHALWHRPD